MLYYYRGETFRREFAQLGELRSLVSSDVHVMAMTATATCTTRKAIFKVLHMVKPKIVYVKPVRDNITYVVAQKSLVFDPIIRQLMEERMSMGRIIIFLNSVPRWPLFTVISRDQWVTISQNQKELPISQGTGLLKCIPGVHNSL